MSLTADAAATTPIDHAYLRRFTFGNLELEREVLQLFADQAPITFGQLKDAADQKAWRAAAHTLKGSARAVGALSLGDVAETAEKLDQADGRRSEILASIDRTLTATVHYISGLPAG